ncbi:RBBP9/YdeN family alpha/beta hydrolase [Kitasatospora viridis]|uniref:Alpha/beta hydrolase family protein n=1 Tax=Kitasatospora viridis TaxID=281105 RepID=A0A561ULS3_9ACTN|nr:alpha/beta hydrolase [Kitasatospora viridis]TWG00300.1 hypothetical protein FHX73_114174 [Kitasatospora viridis]
MSTVIVSHAITTTPDDLWYPHLKADLTADGRQVLVPALPDPNSPQPAAWAAGITGLTAAVEPAETVLVGHSLGGVNLLRVLQQHDTERRGAFAGVVLVATMAHEVGYDPLKEFFDGDFDWQRIRAAAGRVRILVAADDPVLVPEPFEHVRTFVTELGATAVVLPEGGHLPNWSPGALPEVTVPQVTALVREILAEAEAATIETS